MVPYNTPLHKSKQRWIMQIWLILTNYNELDDVEPKINEYSQVIGSRGWEWRPKKQEFLHFIFVLTYAVVYCRGPSKQACKHFLEQVGGHSIVDVVGYLYIGQSTTKYYIPYLELNDPSNCQTFFLACMSFIIGRVNLYYFLLFPRCDSLCFLKAAVVVDTMT